MRVVRGLLVLVLLVVGLPPLTGTSPARAQEFGICHSVTFTAPGEEHTITMRARERRLMWADGPGVVWVARIEGSHTVPMNLAVPVGLANAFPFDYRWHSEDNHIVLRKQGDYTPVTVHFSCPDYAEPDALDLPDTCQQIALDPEDHTSFTPSVDHTAWSALGGDRIRFSLSPSSYDAATLFFPDAYPDGGAPLLPETTYHFYTDYAPDVLVLCPDEEPPPPAPEVYIPDACTTLPLPHFYTFTLGAGTQDYYGWSQRGVVSVQEEDPVIPLPTYPDQPGYLLDAATTYHLTTGEIDDLLILCPAGTEIPTTPTPTPTPVVETGFIDGVCDDGDFYCDYGRGTIITDTVSLERVTTDYGNFVAVRWGAGLTPETVNVTAAGELLSFNCTGSDAHIQVDGVQIGSCDGSQETHHTIETTPGESFVVSFHGVSKWRNGWARFWTIDGVVDGFDLGATEHNALAEPGLWRFSALGDTCHSHWSSTGDRILRWSLGYTETNVFQANAPGSEAPGAIVEYVVPMFDPTQHSLGTLILTPTLVRSNWGVAAFACNVTFEKLDNNTTQTTANGYDMALYHAGVWPFGEPVYTPGYAYSGHTVAMTVTTDTTYHDMAGYSSTAQQMELTISGAPCAITNSTGGCLVPVTGLLAMGPDPAAPKRAQRTLISLTLNDDPLEPTYTPTSTPTATSTSTPTVTNTPTSTRAATPVPPDQCRVYPIYADAPTDITFPAAYDVYAWQGTIRYSDTLTLAAHPDTPLRVLADEEWTFTPVAGDDRYELLLCPASVGTPTPTPTAMATAQPPDECEDIILAGQERTLVAVYLDERTTIQDVSPACTGIDPACTLWAGWQSDGHGLQRVPRTATWWGAFHAARTGDDTAPAGDQSFRAWGNAWSYADQVEAVMRVCRYDAGPTPTASVTRTPAPTDTPVSAPSSAPVIDSTSACVPASTPEYQATRGPVPDLGIVVPTWEPITWVTATMEISVEVVIDTVWQAHDQMQTPVVAMRTATSTYDWEGGQQVAASFAEALTPGLEWLAVANVTHPAYSLEGTPFWALAPVLIWIAPSIMLSIVLVFLRFFFWMLDWLRKLMHVIFAIIELIPGE